jgi:preprotein translocase subunit SecD
MTNSTGDNAADQATPESQPPHPDYQAGYGYVPMPAPMPASRSRFAIVGAVAALGLTALIVASAMLVLGGGHTPGPSSTIVFQVMPVAGHAADVNALDTTATILKARLDAQGIDGTVEKSGPDRVTVQVFGVADLAALAASLAATGKVEFILLPKATYGDVMTAGSTQTPDDGSVLDGTLPAQFTGADLDKTMTSAATDPTNTGYWKVQFGFSGAKADEFGTWTAMHVNEFFVIAVDRKILSVPYIQSAISVGTGDINGKFTEAQAKSLAASIKSGALPYPLQVVSAAGPTASQR